MSSDVTKPSTVISIQLDQTNMFLEFCLEYENGPLEMHFNLLCAVSINHLLLRLPRNLCWFIIKVSRAKQFLPFPFIIFICVCVLFIVLFIFDTILFTLLFSALHHYKMWVWINILQEKGWNRPSAHESLLPSGEHYQQRYLRHLFSFFKQ